MKYRCRHDLRAGILRVCEKPKRVTQIVKGIRAASGEYCQLVHALAKEGLLQQENRTYVITSNGKEWLHHYEALNETHR